MVLLYSMTISGRGPVDALDAALIELLAAEPRVGVLEASKRLRVARGTVQARLDRMTREGVIRGWGPELDPAAYVLHRFAVIRHRALIIVLVFTVLCLGFFAFAANVSALGPETVAFRDALVGNAIAAFAIGAYLARLLPREDER